MKVKILLSILLALSVCISCNKDDDDNPEPKKNNTTNGLIFNVQDNSNAAVSGATIGICYTISEAISNTFIDTKVSDSEGKAVFASLDAGDYYYKVTSSFGEETQQFSYDGNSKTLIVQVN